MPVSTIFNDVMKLSADALPMIEKIDGQLTPGQLLKIIACLSQTPRILARFLVSFVELAKACKEISSKEAFMDSLRESSRFMYDFVNTMSDTYIEKDTVKIDGRYFRFFSMYKREILKRLKIGKMREDDVKLMKKRMKVIMHCLNETFLKRHMRNLAIKRWKSSFVQLNKVSKNITYEDLSVTSLEEFIPSELRSFADFLDKSP
jgi:hypothetical protein